MEGCPARSRLFKSYARLAKDPKRGRDCTRYSARYHVPFLSHHMRRISSAAVFSDAAGIEAQGTLAKTRAAHVAFTQSVSG